MAVMLAQRQTLRTYLAPTLIFLAALLAAVLWIAAPSLLLWWLLVGVFP